MRDAWLTLLLNEELFFKVLGILSHVPMLVSSFSTLFKGYIGPAIMLFFVVFESLGYHICASFDMCAGQTIQKWKVGDYSTVTGMAIVVLNLWNMPRDLYLALAELSRREIFIHSGKGSRKALEIAPRQFATSSDVPLIRLVQFHLGMIVFQLMTLVIVRNFYPTELYGLIVALLFSMLPVLVYALAFRREVVRVTPGGQPIVLPSHTYDYAFLAASAFFGAIGIGCFLFQSNENSGWHSAWHIFAGLAIECFVQAIHRAKRDEVTQHILDKEKNDVVTHV